MTTNLPWNAAQLASDHQHHFYQSLLKAGPRLKPLQQVHAHLIVTGAHRSRSLLTKLAALACTSKSHHYYTHKLLFSIPNPDSYLFNTLIRISSKLGFVRDAVFFYRRMILCSISPTNYTFTSLIKACSDISELRLGKTVHNHVLVGGFGSDSFVQAALVTFYAKCGGIKVARKVFDRIPETGIIAWNAMIAGYEQNGFARGSLELFDLMMKLGVEPDGATFVSVLSACAQLGAVELGCWVHDYIIEKKGFGVNVVLGTALINMYARCGNMKKAREVFDGMVERNVVAWTSLISGYGIHGCGYEAMELFHSMRTGGPEPNEITFVAVLSACAHAGLVDEGREVFKSISRDYGLVPGVEHHVCMVDMLGRAGLVDEAFNHVKGLKRPSAAVWTAMVGACKMHKNLDLGVQAADNLLALEPHNPGHYVMLSNIYALAGRTDRVEMIRNGMIRKGLKKHVGYSVIEVGRKPHLFCMGDKSHAEAKEIYMYLDDLMRRIGEAGYVPAQESILHVLEEEERDYALRDHSEKLAIAYGLMRSSGDGTTIRIVKNLRTCEDCHLAMKFISVVAGRDIVVRDKLRFHHFRDGKCSCGDYW